MRKQNKTTKFANINKNSKKKPTETSTSYNECLPAKRIQQPLIRIASEIASETTSEIEGSPSRPIFFDCLDAAFKTKQLFKK